ncbi:large-conductance mechanosensitive channel [Flavobacterium sp. HSC-32F16]|uniref:hypothetical protein n=1 Tax=Flavobacterium sp. HSC-32F16 TaxID=2910964 RepID=UPI0020A27550|nr:hypothetical protein [Flavobacterium sp. HSC-32F16]MCP2026945.1 large-conductance mechanosensitive channel [Flavobacterium sp. HSC-32F16]
MKKLVLFILLSCFSVYGKTVSDSIANQIRLLNDKQKSILYEFEVLKKNGFDTAPFWLKNKNQFPQLTEDVRDELAKQVFVNSHVIYSPPKNSAVQFWMKTQLLTNWMFYLSAFIAICALIALFKRYWSLLLQFLINRLAPLLRILFSPVLLTYELLLIGAACVFYGCEIEEFVLRTVIIHLGLFLLWSQSTAVFTREYWVKKYVYEIENNFWGSDPWETVKTICLPAIIVTLALVYVLYKIPAAIFYNYEIVVFGIAAVYALPFWRSLEKYLYPILLPCKSDYRARSINSLAGCTVLAIVVTIILVFQWNSIFYNVIAALISLLLLSLLIMSSKMNFRYSYKNYYYLQFLTILFIVLVFLYSYSIHLNEIIWFSLIAASLFIIIKYLEIISFFSDWKRGKSWAWKLMGLSGLLWLLGKGILYVSTFLFS